MRVSTAGKRKAVAESKNGHQKATLSQPRHVPQPRATQIQYSKKGTAIVYDTEESPVYIIDPSLPISEESTF